MKITENFRLGFDAYNVIVEERFEKKDGKGPNAKGTGEFDYKQVGYCKNFESACQFILQREIRSSEAAGVPEMLEAIKLIGEELKASIEAAGINHQDYMAAASKKKKEAV